VLSCHWSPAPQPEWVARLTLRRSVVSWADVVRTPLARLQYVNAVHGVLKVYDLPDLVGTLPADGVELIDPRRADGKPVKKSNESANTLLQKGPIPSPHTRKREKS